MSRFYKVGLIFFLSTLGLFLTGLKSSLGQCSFTNLNSNYCENESSFVLTGGTNYFGPGVTGNSFDPSIAGVGSHQLVTTNGLATSYSVITSGSFSPEPPVAPTGLVLTDNDEQLVNIGFTFNFFGTDYTQLRVGSNGVLGMGAGPALTSVNDNQALGDLTNPNNIIALAWDDLTPDLGGTIQYFSVGAAPFRKFVIDYISVDRTTGFNVTVQAQLFETTNIIELHTTSAPFAANAQTATQGIESQDLGSGVTTSYGLAARNNTQWDATNDFISFVPTCLDIQTVTVNALPSASLAVSPANTSVCAGSVVPVTITSAAAGVLYQLRNSADDTALSGFFLGSGGNLVINSGPISADVTIKVFARHATTLCENDLTNEVTVTVDPSPTVAIAGGDQNVCGVTTTLAGNVAGVGIGVWSFVTNPDALPITAFSNTASPTSDFTGTPGLNYVLRWTISSGSCTASFDDVQVHFDAAPAPAADAGPPQTLCATSTTLAGNTPTTGTGTWTVVSGAGGSFVNANSPTTVFNGVAGTAYDLQWTISNGVCASSSDNVTIQFDAPPTLASAGPNQNLCSPTAMLAANAPIVGTGQWTVFSGVGGSFVLGTDPATVFNGISGNTYILRWTTTNGVCSTQDDVQIYFYPIPDVSAADKAICSGSNASVVITNPNAVAGTTFSWTVFSSTNVTGASGGNGSLISQILNSTDAINPGTVVYRIIPSASGCPGTPLDVTVTVNPVPVITNTPASLIQSVCSGTTLNFLPTSTIGSTIMSWTSSISGALTGVSATGSGQINDTPVNTGNTTATVTYQITPSVGGCPGIPVNYVVDVRPIPVANAASPENICSGETTDIVIANPNNVVGTTYSWTLSGASNISGAAIGSGSVISQTLTSTDGINPGTIDYIITPNANGCAGSPISVSVNVTPKPVITNTPTSFIQDICSATPLNFLPTSSIGSTTFNWTATVIGTLSGVSASGSGVINDTPVNATNTNGVIIYTITPVVSGCSGNAVNLVVTVRPVPTALAANQSICSGESTSIAITNPNAVAGTTYSWTAVATNVSGASNGAGSTISQLLTSTDGTTDGTVIYTITPSANGCPGPTYNVTATVKPVPVMTNTPASYSQQICSGEALSFNPTSSIGGTTFSWTSIVSGPIEGASVTASGSGSVMDSPINTGSISGTVTYRITPNFNGCSGLPVDLIVTVKPEPSATASNLTICSGEAAVANITPGPKNVAGTTFAWTAVASPNVSGWSNGNGSIINQVLTTTNQFVGTVTYSITPSANSCDGAVANIIVTVNPVATVNAGADFAVCESITIPLSGTIGGSASTGTWTIVPGFGSGTVSASTTTGATVTATYTVNAADIGGQVRLLLTSNDPDGVGPCSTASDQLIIDVNRRPVVTAPADYTVCEPSSINLTGSLSGSASTGVWSLLSGTGTLSASSVTGPTVTASYVPSAADVGTDISFRLTSNISGVCAAGTDDLQIHINQTAIVNAGVDFEACEDETINLNGSFSGGTSAITWSGGLGGTYGGINNPITTYTLTAADIANGGVLFTLTSNDPDGAGPCNPVNDQVFVKVNKLPEVFLFGLQPTYAENNPIVSLDGIPVGGTFTGSGIIAGTNQFDPGSASLGTVDITYSYTNPTTGCSNFVEKSTIVNPVTSIDFDIENQTTSPGGDPQICANSDFLELIGYPAASTGFPQTLFRSPDIPSRIVNVGGANYYLNTEGLLPGDYQIQYIYTNSLLATDTLTKVVTVFAAPKAVINFDRVCVADSLIYTDASFIPVNPSAATIVAYDWSYGEFGNGNDGVTRDPKYKYTDHGSKTVGLTVTTSQGCSHDTTRLIRVGPLPNVDFTWSKVCSGLEVTEFRDISTTPLGYSQISNYQWNFGDGDILPLGPRNQNVPGGTHAGRTTGTFNNPNHDYSSFTTFTVELTVNTEDGCVGTKANDVIILDYITPSPSGGYSTDFEIGSNPWVISTTSTNPSWIYGPPTGNVIQPSASGNHAWWTGNNPDAALTFSTFNNDEKSEVLSPCLNLTDLKRPMISLDYWSDMRGAFDGAVVQFSIDDGNTWETIGDAGGYGINWYDTRDITSTPGDRDFGWSGSKPTQGWINARFNLDQIPTAERDLVRFRIAFESNGDNPTGEILNGFAFDNIYIGEKNRNVLVEHFTNDNFGPSNNVDQALEDMYDEQIQMKDSSDFILVQYHMAGDDINLENDSDPTARQQLYGVSQAPTTIMDGIQGQYFETYFNGLYGKITAQELDRRALEDPAFSITIDTVATGDNTTLGLNIRYTYIDPLQQIDFPVTFHAALVERGINGNGNVVRRLLLGSDGRTVTNVWDASIPTVHEENFDYTIDIPVTNPDSLYILAFVQDHSEGTPTSRRILQSVIVKGPRKAGPVITGIEDSPTVAELKGLVVYPNPASKVVNLHSDINLQRNYTWKLIDQRGVEVLSGRLQGDFTYGDQQIDVGNLPNGMYIMAIQINEKSVVHKKIVVMNRN